MGSIETLRERIDAAENMSDDDSAALLEFSNSLRLQSSTYSDHRHEKLLRHCTRMAEEVGGLADALEDRDAAEAIVRWIHANYDNEETNRDYRVALRVFGRHMSEGDDPPESLDWISSSTSSTYDPSPEPADMITWEETLEMAEAASNPRDAAMVTVAFDSGIRGGEFNDLEVGDVTDHKHGYQITVHGKQGKRTITLIPSVPFLQEWLSKHPGSNDSDAPLWSKLDTAEPISRRMRGKAFERLADHVDIDKPVTITNFRKSSAAHLASKGMSQAHLEDHHGWVRGSRVAARYISVFDDDADRELARVYGREIEDSEEPDPIAPITCPRCGEETPRERDLCVWCGQALEPGAAEKAERVEDILIEELAKADPDDADELLAIREQIRDDPSRLAEAIDRISD